MTRLFTLLSLLILLAACATSRKTASAPASSGAEVPVEVAGNATAQQLYASLTATCTPWQSVQIPVRASLRSPMSVSASGRLTMVRDSLVHLSLRMLGIELAVVSVDNDSVRVFDKFHRYYMAESTAALAGRTGITLPDMQSLLLGRAFVPGHGTVTPAMATDLTLSRTQDGALVITPSAALPYSLEMQARRLSDGHVALCELKVVAGSRTATFTITPCDVPSCGGALASAIDIDARLGQRALSAALTFTPDRAEWNTNPSLQLPSTRGYTRVNLSTLLKSGF
ncbi:MAG: DUF4292 domain-containing protein [Muribaculaceae bacterium]|nr:DUF4292 domain-containing protein [Muribaculaceae bacterium]